MSMCICKRCGFFVDSDEDGGCFMDDDSVCCEACRDEIADGEPEEET
jgi:hypothetical protein